MSPGLEYVGRAPALPVLRLRGLLEASDDAFLAVAYVRSSGVGLVEKEVGAFKGRGGRLRLLTTFDFGLTQPAALERLMDLGAEVRVAQYGDRAYHPKVYLGRGAEGPRALVGSANLTAAGLMRNVEGGVWATGSAAERLHVDAWEHCEELWGGDAVVDCPRGLQIPPQPRAPRRVIDLGLPRPRAGRSLMFGESREVPSDDEEFEDVWAEVLHRARVGAVFRTAQGRPNTVLAVDPLRGLLLATETDPQGSWVPPDMFERVVAAVGGLGELVLNAPKGRDVLDATMGLRVFRSSAVFAVLGSLDRYELVVRPRAALRRVTAVSTRHRA